MEWMLKHSRFLLGRERHDPCRCCRAESIAVILNIEKRARVVRCVTRLSGATIGRVKYQVTILLHDELTRSDCVSIRRPMRVILPIVKNHVSIRLHNERMKPIIRLQTLSWM
jgi:hypothetical protein